MSDTHKTNLSARILIAMVAGMVLGLVINALLADVAWVQTYLVDGLFDLVRKLFVNSLLMMVVPLVLVSLICGVSSLAEPAKLGRLGGKSIGLYMLTTAIAITLALTLANLIQPGLGVTAPVAPEYQAVTPPSLVEVLANIIPANPLRAMTEGNMLQVIVFAILFGIAIAQSGERGRRIAEFFNDVNEVILKLVTLIMHLAPYGVFCIMAQVIAKLGIEQMLNLAIYFGLVMFVLVLHASITYPTLLRLFAGLNPMIFLRKIRPAMLFAFGTASSAATLPVTMEVARKRLGVDNTTAAFTLPLGATINMDGTAIMQGVATVFFAQFYGIDLSTSDYLVVILTATLASIGTAGVPGVGLVMLALVLNQVNIPTEGIAMILGIDRLLDMTRTAVNITGDAAIASIVSHSERSLNTETFNDPEAGVDFEETDVAKQQSAA